MTFLKNKKASEVDSPEVRYIKGLIRKGEARSTSFYVGIPEEQIHFMELPFYETGTIKKNPIGEADIQITMDLIDKIKPHQIYAAGDLADPHGTHKVCLDAVFEAVKRLKPKKIHRTIVGFGCTGELGKNGESTRLKWRCQWDLIKYWKNEEEYLNTNRKKMELFFKEQTAGSFGKEPRTEIKKRPIYTIN